MNQEITNQKEEIELLFQDLILNEITPIELVAHFKNIIRRGDADVVALVMPFYLTQKCYELIKNDSEVVEWCKEEEIENSIFKIDTGANRTYSYDGNPKLDKLKKELNKIINSKKVLELKKEIGEIETQMRRDCNNPKLGKKGFIAKIKSITPFLKIKVK